MAGVSTEGKSQGISATLRDAIGVVRFLRERNKKINKNQQLNKTGGLCIEVYSGVIYLAFFGFFNFHWVKITVNKLSVKAL